MAGVLARDGEVALARAAVAAVAARAVAGTGAIVERTTSMVEPGRKLALQ